MTVTDFYRSRLGGWVVALGFVVFWYALLQGLTYTLFDVSLKLESLPRDLLANLLLGAILYAMSRGLRTFLPAAGALMTALHLSNAGKVVVLGAPVMPDDFSTLHNLFLLLEGWQFVGAVLILAVPAVLLMLSLAWSAPRTWVVIGLTIGLVGLLVMQPGAVVRAMDNTIGNTVWNQRGNYEHRGLLIHLVQEGARYLERMGSPPSAGEVGSAFDLLNAGADPLYTPDAKNVAAGRNRNVHFIVLESFWDPTKLRAAGLSGDPVDARFRALWHESGESHAMSPVFGGYTANAEFEVLCGFPVTEDAVFFEGRLRRDVPCLPKHLADAGYRTIASHPNVAAFWNRVNAYRRIGFDTYWSDSDFALDDMNREFLSDRSLYRQVMQKIRPMLAGDEPVFNYVLTYFGHLDYPLNAERPRRIDAKAGNTLVASYANTMYYKSRELMDFLEQLRKEDPDAVIVLFGDHLPFLGPNFAGFSDSGLLAANRGNFDQAMVQQLVSTPLVIIDGRRGPLALPDVPMYRIPAIVLEILQDKRPTILKLTAAGPADIVRPLPGMHWVSRHGQGLLCRHDETAPSDCAKSGAWLEAVITLTRDLFGGDQHLLQTARRSFSLTSGSPQPAPELATADY